MKSINKKKKDFKLREDIVLEFEKYALPRKQTAIVEQLLLRWVNERKNSERAAQIQRAYEKDSARTKQSRGA